MNIRERIRERFFLLNKFIYFPLGEAVYASGHMTKRGGSHVEWQTVGEPPIAAKYFVVCREYAAHVMLRRTHWVKSIMALKKVKGTLERVLDKNLQDLVRGIRNHKENEVNLLTSFRIQLQFITPGSVVRH